MNQPAVENFEDAGDIPCGTWVRLLRPQLHCEGSGYNTGSYTGRIAGEFCSGGAGVWVTRKARWVRWDGVLQCGTCHREDVNREQGES